MKRMQTTKHHEEMKEKEISKGDKHMKIGESRKNGDQEREEGQKQARPAKEAEDKVRRSRSRSRDKGIRRSTPRRGSRDRTPKQTKEKQREKEQGKDGTAMVKAATKLAGNIAMSLIGVQARDNHNRINTKTIKVKKEIAEEDPRYRGSKSEIKTNGNKEKQSTERNKANPIVIEIEDTMQEETRSQASSQTPKRKKQTTEGKSTPMSTEQENKKQKQKSNQNQTRVQEEATTNTSKPNQINTTRDTAHIEEPNDNTGAIDEGATKKKLFNEQEREHTPKKKTTKKKIEK